MLDISFDKNDDSKACGYLSVWTVLKIKLYVKNIKYDY